MSAVPLAIGITAGVLGVLCILLTACAWCYMRQGMRAEKPAEAARGPTQSSYSNILRRGDMQREAADSFNKRREEQQAEGGENYDEERAALENPPPPPREEERPAEDQAAAARRATQIRESKNIAFEAPQRMPTNMQRTASEPRGLLTRQPSCNSVTRPPMQRSQTLKKQASYNNVMARLNNMDPTPPEAKRKKSVEKLSSYGNVLARFQTNDGNEAKQIPIVV